MHELATGRRLTYAAFDRAVDRACRVLARRGLEPGERVSFICDNTASSAIVYAACFRMGAVAHPIHAVSADAEVAEQVALARPRLVLAPATRAEALGERERTAIVPVEQVACASCGDREEPDEDPVPSVVVLPESAAILYPTAGAGDEPRGVPYTHGNLAALVPSVVRGFRFGPADTHLVILPLGHAAAMCYSFLPAVWCGAALVLAPGFWEIRNEFWRVLGDLRVTFVQTVPTVLVMLQHLPGVPPGDLALSWVASGSAPLPLRLQCEFERRFHLAVGNQFGLTETGPTHVDDPRVEGWRPGTIGLPLDVNEVRILDEDGRSVPDGAEGEIAVRGANVFAGYHVNTAGAEGRFTRGYFRTGDLGRRHAADGRFEVTGRLKPLIIRGGLNVHPGEIDRALGSHPAVAAVRTTATPDEYLGESVVAEVTVRPGTSVTPADLRDHCRSRLSAFKIPDVIRLAPRG